MMFDHHHRVRTDYKILGASISFPLYACQIVIRAILSYLVIALIRINIHALLQLSFVLYAWSIQYHSLYASLTS